VHPSIDLLNRADEWFAILAAAVLLIAAWRLGLGRFVSRMMLRGLSTSPRCTGRVIDTTESLVRDRSGAVPRIWMRGTALLRGEEWKVDDLLFAELESALRRAEDGLDRRGVAGQRWESAADHLVATTRVYAKAISRLEGRGLFPLEPAGAHPLRAVLECLATIAKVEDGGLRGPRVSAILDELQTRMNDELGEITLPVELQAADPNRCLQALLQTNDAAPDCESLYFGQLDRFRRRASRAWRHDGTLPQEDLGCWLVAERLRDAGFLAWALEIASIGGGGHRGCARSQLLAWTAFRCAEGIEAVRLEELVRENEWLREWRADRRVRSRPAEMLRELRNG